MGKGKGGKEVENDRRGKREGRLIKVEEKDTYIYEYKLKIQGPP